MNENFENGKFERIQAFVLSDSSGCLQNRQKANRPVLTGTPPKERKAAFTLAEVIITLVVIGVVAAITVPMMINQNGARVDSERHANIVYAGQLACPNDTTNHAKENRDTLQSTCLSLKSAVANSGKSWPFSGTFWAGNEGIYNDAGYIVFSSCYANGAIKSTSLNILCSGK